MLTNLTFSFFCEVQITFYCMNGTREDRKTFSSRTIQNFFTQNLKILLRTVSPITPG